MSGIDPNFICYKGNINWAMRDEQQLLMKSTNYWRSTSLCQSPTLLTLQIWWWSRNPMTNAP